MSRVNRYKLESTFGEDSVVHTTYRTDLAARERNTAVQTKWTDGRILGSGGFGMVIIQQTDSGELRAVKKILKGGGKVDYSRELSVLTKMAHVRTPTK